MSDRTFTITQCPYYEDVKVFGDSSITINEGVTVLVGCNGAGKTTMLCQIKKQVEKAGDVCVLFDNTQDGGEKRLDYLLNVGEDNSVETVCNLITSSEGEGIYINVRGYAKKIGQAVAQANGRDVFILFDAVDSGFSIDNVCDLKDGLFRIIPKTYNGHVYIICSANSYEMANGEDCVDVINCAHIKFDDYEDYRAFILKTREKKNERYTKQSRRSQGRGNAQTFHRRDRGRSGVIEGKGDKLN